MHPEVHDIINGGSGMQELGLAILIFVLLVLEVPAGSCRRVVIQLAILLMMYATSTVGASLAGWGGSIFGCLALYVGLSLTGVLDLTREPYP